MALTGWSTNNYLNRAAAVRGSYPLLISAWGNVPSHSNAWRTLAVIGQDGNATHRFAQLSISRSGHSPGNAPMALTSDATASGSFAISTGMASGAWVHLAGAWPATDLREAWRNATDKDTETTSRSPDAPDVTRVGLLTNGNEPWTSNGGIAEVSVWDGTGLDADDRAALAAKLQQGESPLAINAEAGQAWTGKLVAYWRLLDDTDLDDYSGNGHHLTMVGTLTNFASHPPVDDPPGPAPAGFPHSQGVIIA